MRKQNITQRFAPKYIDRQSLATRWLCSVETLKRRERQGILPFSKNGRRVLYAIADVEHIEAAMEVSR